MKSIDAMLCWNRRGDAAVVCWPDADGLSSGYEMTALAPWAYYRELDDVRRVLVIYTEAMHAIVRDGVDPLVMHAALFSIDEYRETLSDDMPGLLGVDLGYVRTN